MLKQIKTFGTTFALFLTSDDQHQQCAFSRLSFVVVPLDRGIVPRSNPMYSHFTLELKPTIPEVKHFAIV